MRADLETFVDDLVELDAVIAHETTDFGWRGLTAQGEVLEVRSSNGHKAVVPSEITVAHQGHAVGRRRVSNDWTVSSIADYLLHFNQAIQLYRTNNNAEALIEAEAAVAMAPTARARFNRSQILLALGRWHEGLKAYWECEQEAPFMRPQARAALDAGLRPWQGEDPRGKRILLLHAHGFGDTIMTLRFVPALRAIGAQPILVMPRELERLAAQVGPVVDELQDADFFCPMLHLLHMLEATPDKIAHGPYLSVDRSLVGTWSGCVKRERRNVGLAWSVGKPSTGDYPREIPLRELTMCLGDAQLHSVQAQGRDTAERLGVNAYTFADLADCAALMMRMDEIISVDTAALHLAGAIGHPHVTGLLSHWASWRWIAPWYGNMRLVRQTVPDDWSSALDHL
jgi:hypothetical protein